MYIFFGVILGWLLWCSQMSKTLIIGKVWDTNIGSYWEMAKKLWQTVQVIEALDLGGIFLQIWVVDVDGDSSFDWGKTLGPSKPVFLGIKFSLPWSLGSIILSSYLWVIFFLNSTMFGSVIFHGQKERALEIRRFIQVSTKNSSHQLLGCEKFIRNQPITILGFVVTSKTRTKKSRNNLESAGECYDGPVWGYQCPSSFHCVPQGLSISCLWCFQWTSNCINTFYAHLCNCRGLPWRGSFKMTGKRKAGGRCCAGSSLRAPADAEHLVAIENSPKKKTACCFAWGCFLTHLPISDFQATPKTQPGQPGLWRFFKRKGRRGAQRPAARASDDFRCLLGQFGILSEGLEFKLSTQDERWIEADEICRSKNKIWL